MGKKVEQQPQEPAGLKTKTTTQTQRLKVKLTPEELLAYGQKLTDQLMDCSETKDEAKSVASTYKAKVDSLEAAIVVTRNLVHNKYEIREVECVNVLNFTTGRAVTTRTDTQEIIEDRPLRFEERESSLPFDDEKDGTDAAATDGQ